MAVHAKNKSFAELQQEKIASSVQDSIGSMMATTPQQETTVPEPPKPAAQPITTKPAEKQADIKTVTSTTTEKKKKDVLIGIHVTEDERNELRQMFCSNGFSLATAYRAAMTYLRQDIELGKAYITSNGEIFRK